MVTLAALLTAINPRKNRILLMAEAALSEAQFRAFRRLLLDELGREGLERDIERLLAAGTVTQGQADTGKKGGVR